MFYETLQNVHLIFHGHYSHYIEDAYSMEIRPHSPVDLLCAPQKSIYLKPLLFCIFVVAVVWCDSLNSLRFNYSIKVSGCFCFGRMFQYISASERAHIQNCKIIRKSRISWKPGLYYLNSFNDRATLVNMEGLCYSIYKLNSLIPE